MQHKTGIRLAAGALLVAALVASAALLEVESHGVFRSSQWAHSPDNLLRLHVLAHSDAPEDQAAKLAVRDAVLREMASWQLPEDRVQMERWVKERESRLLDAARRALAEREDPHEVRVEVGTFAFAETSWRGGSLPAGQYRAVRVVIGDGAGQNWWCVLFPPLCFAETGDDEGAPPLGGAVAQAKSADGDEVPAAAGEAGENGEGGVVWKVRLWEIFSESAVLDRVKDLVDTSVSLARKLSL
ncbi:MAG: hypothetical protein CW345_01820 [Firmicutes bacterium]|nr:hypothetical protein [Bacillota bacterium]